jgi:uncharacterized protein YlxW (UPF0749 family)
MSADRPAGPERGFVRRGVLRLLRPQARRVDLLVAVLLAVLGFGLAVQVRSTQDVGILTSARPEDLVQILDELGNRSDRLREEVTSLTESQQRLTSGSGASASALAEAQRRTQLLGVIAGTLPAHGPGVTVTITDPQGHVSASLLLDALEELRNAGAEAVQLGGEGGKAVRVVGSTALVDDTVGVRVDGVLLRPPYRFVVVGDALTLAGAMAIPGGVEDTVQQQGGQVSVQREQDVVVSALHALTTPRYARPQ